MDLHDLAKQLERTGVLVRLTGGNDFKAQAWERAARGIEALDHPIDGRIIQHQAIHQRLIDTFLACSNQVFLVGRF